jgi:hypothetical protein
LADGCSLNYVKYIKDIDVTTGDEHSLGLSIAAGDFWKDAHFKIFDDGHSSLVFKNITIDFSNNFNLPGIEEELIYLDLQKSSMAFLAGSYPKELLVVKSSHA